MEWIKLNKKDIAQLKQYESVLVAMNHHEYPYDIIQYGVLDGKEYWHSYLHISTSKYQYSTEELLDEFSHYMPIINPNLEK